MHKILAPKANIAKSKGLTTREHQWKVPPGMLFDFWDGLGTWLLCLMTELKKKNAFWSQLMIRVEHFKK